MMTSRGSYFNSRTHWAQPILAHGDQYNAVGYPALTQDGDNDGGAGYPSLGGSQAHVQMAVVSSVGYRQNQTSSLRHNAYQHTFNAGVPHSHSEASQQAYAHVTGPHSHAYAQSYHAAGHQVHARDHSDAYDRVQAAAGSYSAFDDDAGDFGLGDTSSSSYAQYAHNGFGVYAASTGSERDYPQHGAHATNDDGSASSYEGDAYGARASYSSNIAGRQLQGSAYGSGAGKGFGSFGGGGYGGASGGSPSLPGLSSVQQQRAGPGGTAAPPPRVVPTGPAGEPLLRLDAVLPARYRCTLPYPTLNAVQSRAFDAVYHSDANVALAAPTGCGKTTIFELGILRLLLQRDGDVAPPQAQDESGGGNGTSSSSGAGCAYSVAGAKVVYLSPSKALCSERQRDWAGKFGPLGIRVVSVTGDSDAESGGGGGDGAGDDEPGAGGSSGGGTGARGTGGGGGRARSSQDHVRNVSAGPGKIWRN